MVPLKPSGPPSAHIFGWWRADKKPKSEGKGEKARKIDEVGIKRRKMKGACSNKCRGDAYRSLWKTMTAPELPR